jgi:RNA polymerase-interacting CarD/CdnL/TRCF family regulator
MELKVGDQVVHPKYGVGNVVSLKDREFEPGMLRTYYEISMLGTTLWVSMEMPTFGLRKLTVRSEISRCRKILASHPAPLTEDPRQRQSEMADRLKLGTITAHCEVVRDLSAYFGHKPSSGKIGAFLQVARDVLCQEWAEVEGITLAEAVDEINTLLEKSRETLSEEKR